MPELSYFDLVFKSLDASCDVSRFHSTEQELDDFFSEEISPMGRIVKK
jgi:hypothetical protein